MARVELKSARTSKTDPAEAAEALCDQLGSAKPKLVTVFASSDRDQARLNAAMRERLPKGTRLIGATTSGEIDNDGMHQGCVVAAALEGDLEVGIGLGKGLTDDAVACGAQALARAAEDLGVRPHDLDPKKHVGLVMDDGFRYKKEELLLGVLDKCPSLTLVGGGAAYADISAPDARGTLHADGEVATDAVLVTLIKTTANFGALRSHWYTPTGQTVRITKVDESCTRALEIDGQPAAKRYAEILGRVGRRPRVRQAEGLRLPPHGVEGRPRALHPRALEAAPRRLGAVREPPRRGRRARADGPGRSRGDDTAVLPGGAPAARAVAHRFAALPLRRAHVVPQSLGRLEELSASFRQAPPSAGFNVHFEIYSGFQINTTLTVLAFGSNDA